MVANETTTQIFFTVASRSGDQPKPSAEEQSPTLYMGGHSGLKAVYRNGQEVDQRVIEKYAMEHPTLSRVKPSNNGKKADSDILPPPNR